MVKLDNETAMVTPWDTRQAKAGLPEVIAIVAGRSAVIDFREQWAYIDRERNMTHSS